MYTQTADFILSSANVICYFISEIQMHKGNFFFVHVSLYHELLGNGLFEMITFNQTFTFKNAYDFCLDCIRE